MLKSLIDLIRYSAQIQKAKTLTFDRVLFVCKGNICRSAFAAGYLKNFDTSLKVESRGLQVDREVRSPNTAISAAIRHGVDLTGHYSRPVTAHDVNGADLILAMEYSQYHNLREMFPSSKDKIHLLGCYSTASYKLCLNIYDPFGREEKDYDACFNKIKTCINALICSRNVRV
ncbi:protein-tyrosine-phosphatase [Geomonas paludis]|nr:protein-tyrosine-phosphatase [Geomonas paludis]